ncbi:MAG TPA: prepilin-type N-terminal cleavage/methylation domain-containing protein [Pyrinomonadaceae bacterium]|nr:prepilin-type N-terminal cleavage/methylation domain-containing protein [Pyrinomonadaceae bacterium]
MSHTPNKETQRGFSLVELLIVVAIIGIIAAIAILYMNQAKQAVRSASAMNSLRVISTGQNSYRATRGEYGDLAELGAAGYLTDENLAAGEKAFYTFVVTPGADPSLGYTASATPVQSTAVERHFFINETGILRVAVGAAATSNSPPVD